MALLRFLCGIGTMTRADAEALRQRLDAAGERYVDALARDIGDEKLARLLSEHCDLELVDVDRVAPESGALRRVGKELALRYEALPLRDRGTNLAVVFANPLDAEAIKAIEFAARVRVRSLVAPRSSLLRAIGRAYGTGEVAPRALDAVGRQVPDAALQAAHASPTGAGEAHAAHPATVRAPQDAAGMVDHVLAEALRLGASDVAIEPNGSGATVRYSVAGSDHLGPAIAAPVAPGVAARLEAMAGLDGAAQDRLQTGLLALEHEGRRVAARLSLVPASLGRRIRIRFSAPEATGEISLADCGVDGTSLESLRRELSTDGGLVLIAGPLGSGRRTTARSLVAEARMSGRRVATLDREAPPNALPEADVVFAGEILDAGAACASVELARDRVVVATIEALDASDGIARLCELGAPADGVAAALRIALAQRTVRRICASCRRNERPSELYRARLGAHAETLTSVSHGVGCDGCGHTGFAGHVGFFEVAPMTPALRTAVAAGATAAAIRTQVRADGVPSLLRRGVDVVAAWRTPIAEILRVVSHDEPATESERPAVAHEDDASDGATEFCILVVDDDPVALKVMGHALAEVPAALRVLTAASGSAALAMLEQDTIHFAILDVTMPEMSGLELCEIIRQQERHAAIPIFMLTAREQLEFKSQAFRAGADDYLIKPISKAELVARVARALSRSYGVSVELPAARSRPSGARPTAEPRRAR